MKVAPQQDAHWQTPVCCRQQPTPEQRAWLLDKRSLSDKLVRRAGGQFRVHLLRQAYGFARPAECRLLGDSYRRWVLLREVLLLAGDTPWVYARTLIPLSSLRGRGRRLGFLGERSLGSALFSDPKLKRTELQIASIAPSYLASIHSLSMQAPSVVASRQTWGRRSLFYFHAKPLLVTEVFLPTFWESD